MKYYKVKIDCVYDHKTGYTTVKNELLTEKEKDKRFPTLSAKCFTQIEANPNATYMFFGARFLVD